MSRGGRRQHRQACAHYQPAGASFLLSPEGWLSVTPGPPLAAATHFSPKTPVSLLAPALWLFWPGAEAGISADVVGAGGCWAGGPLPVFSKMPSELVHKEREAAAAVAAPGMSRKGKRPPATPGQAGWSHLSAERRQQLSPPVPAWLSQSRSLSSAGLRSRIMIALSSSPPFPAAVSQLRRRRREVPRPPPVHRALLSHPTDSASRPTPLGGGGCNRRALSKAIGSPSCSFKRGIFFFFSPPPRPSQRLEDVAHLELGLLSERRVPQIWGLLFAPADPFGGL